MKVYKNYYSNLFLIFTSKKMKQPLMLLWLMISAVALGCSGDIETEPIEMKEEENNDSGEENHSGEYTYLALGDSYTIGESVESEERFPMQLAKKLNDNSIPVTEPEIVAQTGWTTDELEEGIKNSELDMHYDLVTLLIGVNNQYRGRDTSEYRIQFSRLLNQSIEFAGSEDAIIVISIPDYGATPFGQERNPQKIAKEIATFNAINLMETQKTRAHYVNITGISVKARNDENLVAGDGLHPSGEMYRLWVEKIYPVAKKILENKNL